MQHQTSRLEQLVQFEEEPATRSIVDLADIPREIHADTAREACVAKMRQLADLIECGVLDGVRIQWRDGLHHIETVELDNRDVRLLRHEIYSPERPMDYDGAAVIAESIDTH